MQLARMYREIVETSTDSMWVFDLDGRILHANPACAELLGIPLDAVMGRTPLDFLDEQGRGQFAEHLVDLRAGRFNESEVEVQCVRPTGEVRWVLCKEAPLHDDDGLMGVLHRMTDFTDRRSLVQQLSESEERLAEAQRIARLGSFRWDLASGEVTGSAGLYHLLDLPAAPHPTYDDLLAMVDEDHRDLVAQSLGEAIAAGSDARFVVRVQGRQGWMWARIQGEPVREDGRTVAFAGTVQDVTSTVEAEAALKDQVAQNTLMEAVASAANEASTMTEVLQRVTSMLLGHGAWARAQGFACDGDVMTPLFADEIDSAESSPAMSTLATDMALALQCRASRTLVWDDTGLSLACPVLHAGQVRAVYVITSGRPIGRPEMVEHMVLQAAVQIGRVAEREATARALAAARDTAEEASRQKSTFLAMISHEIRTPLNGVLGLNQLLMRGDLDAEQRRLASGIELSGRTLLSLINNVLDYSKIEAGHLALESVDFDVRAVLDGAIEPHFATGRSKGLAMRTVFDDDVPEVANGDPTRLSQVLANLVSNAVKFTLEGSVHVHVSATTTEGGWLLNAEVRDSGVGTDIDAQTLFAPFQQADSSTTRVFGGTGLGLAISREIVEAFGGEIELESRRGAGTRVWFTVALAVPAGGVVLGADRPATQPSTAVLDAASRRILLAEDNPVNQMVAIGLLESLGYVVETADDGMAALTLFRPGHHDLVLMDVQMPRMDGLAATRALRASYSDHPRVPVIAMTASAVPGERERCLDAGMDDFLTKPVDLQALRQALARWLDQTQPGPPGAEGGEECEYVERVVEGVDLGRLDELRDLDPDGTAYLGRAIDKLTGSLEDHLAEMRDALLAGDLERLRVSAHSLKGSCSNLGLVAASEVLAAVQHLPDLDCPEAALDLVDTAERRLSAGRSCLLDYRARHLRSTDGRAPGELRAPTGTR